MLDASALLDREQLDAEVTALLAGKRMEDPYPILNAVRETAAVYPAGSSVLITRYEDVFAVLTDDEQYSNSAFSRGSRAKEIIESFSPEGQRIWRELAELERNRITHAPPDRHGPRRAAVHRYFTFRRVRSMAEDIQRFVDDLLAEAQEREVFDQKWLASELALRVVSSIIGSPQLDRERIRRVVEVRARGIGATDEHTVRAAYDAHWELDAYIRDVIMAEHRRDRNPTELAASLMAAEDEEQLAPDELVGVISNMIIGGLHTTSGLLTVGMLELMRSRDEWTRLCADPTLIPSAVEELLRFVSPAGLPKRCAARDLRWGEVEIPADTTLILAVAAANRDPRVYDLPDVLDVGRDPQHLALGHGSHFCLGAAVVRHEAQILLGSLAARYPNLELAIDPSDVDWSAGNVDMRALRELPIRLGPGLSDR